MSLFKVNSYGYDQIQLIVYKNFDWKKIFFNAKTQSLMHYNVYNYGRKDV